MVQIFHTLTCLLRSSIIRAIWIFFLPILASFFSSLSPPVFSLGYLRWLSSPRFHLINSCKKKQTNHKHNETLLKKCQLRAKRGVVVPLMVILSEPNSRSEVRWCWVEYDRIITTENTKSQLTQPRWLLQEAPHPHRKGKIQQCPTNKAFGFITHEQQQLPLQNTMCVCLVWPHPPSLTYYVYTDCSQRGHDSITHLSE